MFSYIKYSQVLLILLFISACESDKSWDCLRAHGNETISKIESGSFDKVFLFDKIEYNLIQDTADFLIVKCGDNILSNIYSENDNGLLRIGFKNNCELFRDSDRLARIDIHFRNLQNLEIYSSQIVHTPDTLKLEKLLVSKRSNGNLKINILADEFFIYSNEYGDSKISGKIINASCRQEGVGRIDFVETIIDVAGIYTEGPGTTLLNQVNSLNATVKRNGKLILKSKPQEQRIEVFDDGEVVYEF